MLSAGDLEKHLHVIKRHTQNSWVAPGQVRGVPRVSPAPRGSKSFPSDSSKLRKAFADIS